MTSAKKIAVAMSGGVDSSVCALLLKKSYKSVVGFYMNNWEEEETAFSACNQPADQIDAKIIALQLKIPFYSCDFSERYFNDVFAYFLQEYKNGNTPNPDILCNQKIKFDALYQHILEQGFSRLATGHYARIINTGRYELHQGIDKNKDQSYFLHLLTEEMLSHVEFPLGEIHKSETRNIALANQLYTHAKKDSTGICFIGEKNFRPFLSNYLKPQTGEFRCLDSGQVLGEHNGYHFYTIGQRKGLGIGGVSGKKDSPWYIAKKDIVNNILFVVPSKHPALYSNGVSIHSPHWIHEDQYNPSAPLLAKIRYRQTPQQCSINTAQTFIQFDTPQWAPAAGQSVVFYQGSHCLGGAIISSVPTKPSAPVQLQTISGA